jgi:ribonuclease P protein component
MAAAFPPTHRLRRPGEFRAVLEQGEVFPGREVVVRRLANGLDHPRLGLAAPRRYGKAVRRNRFRRLVREAFRALAGDLGGYDLLVTPKKTLEEPTLEGLRHDLERTRTARPAAARPREDRRR